MNGVEEKTQHSKRRKIDKWQAIERFLIHLLIFLTLVRWVLDFFNRCL